MDKAMKRAILFLVVLIPLIAAGGVFASFTATDETANQWTAGNVTIELLEQEYDDAPPRERQNLIPNKVFLKDPVVRNTGENDAYVFLEVSIPKAKVRTADADGSARPAELQELFAYGISHGWEKVTEETGEADKNTYVYAYTASEGVCAPLATGETSPPLFQDRKLTFINVLEGQGLQGVTLEIPIQAYGIQTADLGESETLSPARVWEALNWQMDSE